MRHVLRVLCLSAILFTAGGCLYLKVKNPLDEDVNRTVLGPKVGRASSYSIAWLVAWGDSGTEAAAREGDLKVINHLDSEYFMILWGVYMRKTTIAYGE